MSTVRLLKNGIEVFPAILRAVDQARASVAVEMFIFSDDGTGREVRDALVRAAARGVDVRVLVDAVGSWGLPESFWDVLTASGGKVKVFRPVMRGLFLFRNHRKLVLIDDRRAFIGGLNVSDEYYRGRGGEAPWRDNALEIDGYELVRLRRSFSRMWLRADHPVRKTLLIMRRSYGLRPKPGQRIRFLESGPEDPLHSVRRGYRQIIGGATTSIDLAMGYFYPHGRLIRALKRAVRHGIRVRLLLPQHSDVAIARWAARGLYGRLLRAGIEVWEYRPSMLHAKMAIIDDTLITGSANLDIRSGRINYELVAVVRDASLAGQARADFENDLKDSERIAYEQWRMRPMMQRLKERVSYWILARLDIFFARAEILRMMR